MDLLAWPARHSTAAIGETGRAVSRERPGRWILSIADRVTRTYRLQAILSTLMRPFTPCAVSFAGRALRDSAWSYNSGTGVLTARFRGKRARLVVEGCLGIDPANAALRASLAWVQGRLLDLVGEVYALLDLDAFRPGLLEALRRAVTVDWASLNDVGPRPEDVIAMSDPPVPAELHARFGQHAHENPLVRVFAEGRQGRVLRLSDFASREELRATSLYREVYAALGLEYQVAFMLPAPHGHVLGVALSRHAEDFTEAECSFLEAARQHLIQAYSNAREHTALLQRLGETRGLPLADLRAQGLTPREAEVVRLMASGRTNADVAAELGLSARTVQTHLQSAYRKLGVRTRSQAARIAWAGYADSAEEPVDPATGAT